MGSFVIIFLLYLPSAKAARLPVELELSQVESQDTGKILQQADGNVPEYMNSESEDEVVSDESSPIESRYEVPDSVSDGGVNFDVIFEDVLRDILNTLQAHPGLLKGLIKNAEQSTKPEEGKEVIDENYPRSDISEESREFEQYLTDIQEGGQDDPMFDYERRQQPGDVKRFKSSIQQPQLPDSKVNLKTDLEKKQTGDSSGEESAAEAVKQDNQLNTVLPQHQDDTDEKKRIDTDDYMDSDSPKYRKTQKKR